MVKTLTEEIKYLNDKIEYDKGKSALELLELEKKNEDTMIKLEGKYEKRLASNTALHLELKNNYNDLMVAATDDRFNLDDYHSQEIAKMKNEYEKEIMGLKDEQKVRS